MDTVFIRELAVDTVIGVYGWERTVRQTLLLDLEMAWDNRPAAAGDELARALDYAAVAERITRFAAGSEFQLIETLAEQVAALVRAEFAVPWLRLRVCKPGAVAAARDVGVLIERGERG
ncbi:dihydroneopterin aldolase [Parahaliea mediterranea]|uniref:7,8-dihydroneopterin aldolase n=1 Tax=Parahaliea mediterranea TaxID=651086 RepID=A0A939DGQ1_9GAMM|nr:dihydroneopterin aldolase [Parahaliea mediterranea]MBN7797800.1 dihydroneopterin aldolase [Parahaliea mediterranea]